MLDVHLTAITFSNVVDLLYSCFLTLFSAFLVHQSMIDIKKYSSSLSKVSNESTLNFGNKLSVLGGDFLLAKASLELGKLENTEVVELISRAIGNLSEGSTMASLPLVGQEQQECSLKDWEDFVFLMKGSLLANSCEAAVTLMDHDRTVCETSFLLYSPCSCVYRS